MPFTTPDLVPALPEIFVLALACTILIVDLFLDDRLRDLTYWLALGTLAGAALLTAHVAVDGRLTTFSGMFVADPFASTLKLFSYLAVAVVFVYSRDYLRARGLFKGEYFVLGLFGLLGMMVMISAGSFLTVYLGLELLSLSLYAMVAFDRDSPVASEAAMKYFVLGAVASGMLLYGMSILYGITGTLDIAALADYIADADKLGTGLLLGLVFVIVGLCFKLGAVPFHMWIPDVYHGAPTAVTLYLGSAPKLAAFALFMRLLVDGLGDLQASWQNVLAILAVLSMAIGSIVAIAQSNLKRMLAYSTIGHVGFVLLGILAGSREGYGAAMFYTVAYVIMATAAFGMIILLSRRGFEADRLDDFRGLNERNPWFAAMMLCVMFSMAGVPPFIGFYAKLSVLWAVLDAGLTWLAVLAVVFSIIAAYYYIRVVKLMYFDAPEDTAPLEAQADMRWLLSANGIAILVLGVYPAGLMNLCLQALGAS